MRVKNENHVGDWLYAAGVVAVATGLLTHTASAAAASMQPQDLVDRAQITDLLVEYYDGLRTEDRHLGSFFTADGSVDVDGWSAKGIKEIDALYARVWNLPSLQHGVRHYLISNEKVVIKAGGAATVDFLWTEISADTASASPKFEEIGTEHDELVKVRGRWYIRYRHVIGEGGVPPGLAPTTNK